MQDGGHYIPAGKKSQVPTGKKLVKISNIFYPLSVTSMTLLISVSFLTLKHNLILNIYL